MRTRPNLLFIFTDQQRPDTMAAYGNSQIEMPNLNALAGKSTVFARTYVTQPVCTPSRASLMTGHYPHVHGCVTNNTPLPSEFRCLPEYLSGYRCGYHGKWHLGDEVFPRHGFEEWVSIEDGYAGFFSEGKEPATRSSYHHFLRENGLEPPKGPDAPFSRSFCARLPEELGKPAFLARTASEFIEKGSDQPWVLCVNFLEPHTPFYGPRDDQYDPAEVPVPPNFNNPPGPDTPLKYRAIEHSMRQKGIDGFPLKTEADFRRVIANYWGLCSLVDTHVGRILDTLKTTGQDRDTIVVFTSDHGEMMGSHRLMTKNVPFEESSRVPMMIHLPGQEEGRRFERPVSQIDLFPTLLDLMGADAGGDLPGRSLAPALHGEPVEPSQVVVEWNPPSDGKPATPAKYDLSAFDDLEAVERSFGARIRTLVRPDGWKFSWNSNQEHELYNLNEDPLETVNFALDQGCATKVRDMTEELEVWRGETGDQ